MRGWLRFPEPASAAEPTQDDVALLDEHLEHLSPLAAQGFGHAGGDGDRVLPVGRLPAELDLVLRQAGAARAGVGISRLQGLRRRFGGGFLFGCFFMIYKSINNPIYNQAQNREGVGFTFADGTAFAQPFIAVVFPPPFSGVEKGAMASLLRTAFPAPTVSDTPLKPLPMRLFFRLERA